MATPLPSRRAPERRGAYGFALAGLEQVGSLLVSAPRSWPTVALIRKIGQPRGSGDRIDAERAEIHFVGDIEVVVERRPRRAVLTAPADIPDQAVLHPCLSPVAAAHSYWDGRESLHAGAFEANGVAWGVLGDKGLGKSSTLAALSQRGCGVVCDDLLVIAGRDALCGPRFLDLRAQTSRFLGIGEPLGKVGARKRWRHVLGSVPPALPLGGWFVLSWGKTVAVTVVPVSDRLRLLFGHRALSLPPSDPEVLLELAALPVWALQRPRGIESLAAAAGLALETVSSL